MKRFTKIYLSISIFTIACATISAVAGAIASRDGTSLRSVLQGLNQKSDREEFEETWPAEGAFTRLSVQWGDKRDVRITRLPDGETQARVRFSGRLDKSQPHPYKIRVHDQTLEIESVRAAPSSGIFAWSALNDWHVSIDAEEIDVTIELPRDWTGDVSVEAIAGDVSVDAFNFGQLTVKTVSGDVHTDEETHAVNLKITSVSGDLKLPGRWSEANVNSVSGDVAMQLPGEAVRRYELGTISGHIENTMPETKNASPSRTTSKAKKESLAASPRIRIQTVSGDVSLRPLGSEDDQD